MSQGVAWFDHYLQRRAERDRQVEARDDRRGEGVEAHVVRRRCRRRRSSAPASAARRSRRTGPKFGQALETFGVSLLKVQVQKVANYPRLVATVLRGQPRDHARRDQAEASGCNTIRLANYVQYLPKGTRLTIVFGDSSGSADVAYLGFGDRGTITLGAAFLSLQMLTKPVSG